MRHRDRFRLAALAFAGRLPVPTSKVRAAAFAVSGGYIPLFQSGAPKPTYTTTTATVVAGMLVEVTGDRSVGPAGAASIKVVGVAAQTGSAIGDKIAADSGGVYNLKASGAIAAGALVMAGALGTVSAVPAVDATNVGTLGTGMTNGRAIVGVALAAIADTAYGPVLLKMG